MKENATKARTPRARRDEMRAEYDFSNAVRGKYYQRYMESTNVIVLDPDVASGFKSSEAVNNALRALLRVAQDNVRISARAAGPARKTAPRSK